MLLIFGLDSPFSQKFSSENLAFLARLGGAAQELAVAGSQRCPKLCLWAEGQALERAGGGG